MLVPRRTATEIESSECGSGGVSVGDIECYLYYRGRAEELPNCSRVVLQFHGGGFVAMDPMCHEGVLSSVPLLSILICKVVRSSVKGQQMRDCQVTHDVFRLLRFSAASLAPPQTTCVTLRRMLMQSFAV